MTVLDRRGLVRRYLAGYGPASVADLQAWSGITGLADAVAGLDLAVLSDEDGRTLYDVPGMTYPDPDMPAPVRLLPEFDNLMVAYTDRRRVMSDDYRKRVCVGAMVAATVLVDGTVSGTWKLRWGQGARPGDGEADD
jgi:Winged helix DNA-binding domain